MLDAPIAFGIVALDLKTPSEHFHESSPEKESITVEANGSELGDSCHLD